MAKSIRSKWKRKCRAIKRERYAVKELTRLKKMLGLKEEDKKEVMEAEEQVIFLDAGALKKGKKQAKPDEKEEEDAEMSSDEEKIEVDGEDKKKRLYSTKTLKDQNGQYPVWLSKRKISKINKVAKKTLKKRSKKRKR